MRPPQHDSVSGGRATPRIPAGSLRATLATQTAHYAERTFIEIASTHRTPHITRGCSMAWDSSTQSEFEEKLAGEAKFAGLLEQVTADL
jgi:hypothetical protein